MVSSEAPCSETNGLLFKPGHGAMPVLWRDLSEKLFAQIRMACENIYGERLISLAIFGSVARGIWKKNSDVDLLVVAKELPRGRFRQMKEFSQVENFSESLLEECRAAGWDAELSPIFKTPPQVEEGSPLFFDMTQEVILLLDRGNMLHNRLKLMSERMKAMGSKRIYRGPDAWTWILKPDLKKGETIVL